MELILSDLFHNVPLEHENQESDNGSFSYIGNSKTMEISRYYLKIDVDTEMHGFVA